MWKRGMGLFYRRRLWWWVLVLLLFGSAPLLRYGYMQMRFPAADVLMAVPRNAIMVIEGEGFLQLAADITSGSVWTSGFSDTHSPDHFAAIADELKLIVGSDVKMADVLSGHRYSVVLTPKKHEGPALLFLLEVGEGIPYQSVHETFTKHWEGFSAKRLLEIDYYERAMDNNQTLYITIQQGILIATLDREVFELAYYTLGSGNSIAKDSGFMDAREQLSKSRNPYPRVYLSHEALYGWFTHFVRTGSRKVFSVIPDMGSWTALELMADQEKIHLQGFTLSPVDHSMHDQEFILPGGVALEDPGTVLPSTTLFYDQWLVGGGGSGVLKALHTEPYSERDYGLPFELLDSAVAILEELHVKAMTYALTAPADSLVHDNGLLLLQSDRIQHAQRAMLLLADTTQGFTHQDFVLTPLAHRHLIPALLGERFHFFRDSWFTAVDDYLIISPSSGELLSLLNAISLQRTLFFESGYRDIGLRMPGALHRRYYFHNGNSPNHLKQIGAFAHQERIHGFMQYMPDQMMISLLEEEDVVLVDIVVGSYDSSRQSDEVAPEVVLDGVPASHPVQYYDHRVQSEKVVVADQTGHIYLISASGDINWKIKAHELPGSALFVVDLFQNGRQQILFLSDNMLHLIQADGKYVQGYPVTLPVPFSGYLSVLDYDRNGNYRIIYKSTDGRLVNTDIRGGRVAGWESPVMHGMSRPVIWHRVGDHDFLVCADSLGGVHVFDRRGRHRFPVEDLPVTAPNSDFALTHSLGDVWLTYVDPEGHLYQVSARGNVQKHELYRFSSGAKLLGLEETKTGSMGFVAVEPSRLSLFDKDIKLIGRTEQQLIGIRSFSAFLPSGNLVGAGLDDQGVPFMLYGDKLKIQRFTDKGYDQVTFLKPGRSGVYRVLLSKGLLLTFYTFHQDNF